MKRMSMWIWRIPERLTRLVAPVLLGVVLILAGCARLPAKYETSPLALRSADAFRGITYTFEDSEPEKVFGLVNYNRSFTDLLASNPAALSEAQRAVADRQLGWASVLGFGTLSVYWSVKAGSAASESTTLGDISEANAYLARAGGSLFLAVVGLGCLRSHRIQAFPAWS